jgi:hypothetical protein
MDLKGLLCASVLITTCLTSTHALAEEIYKKQYTPPSRGFFLELGHVNSGEYVSIELHSGSNSLDDGGGIRLGLENSELIINNGLTARPTNSSDALLKWKLPPIKSGNQQTTDQFQWALLGGISVIETDNSANDQTNLKLGITASLSADVATFTLSPSVVYSEISANDDIYIELGMGAYAGLIDTDSGLFSIGAELNVSSQDDRAETAFEEDKASALLGVRWSYNERINIDIIPITVGSNDLLAIPGIVRLNAVF